MKLKRYKYTRKDRSAPIFIKHAKFEKHILFLRLYCGRPKEDPCTLHKSRVYYREPIPHARPRAESETADRRHPVFHKSEMCKPCTALLF